MRLDAHYTLGAMRSFFQFLVIAALVACGYFLYPVVTDFLRGHGYLPLDQAAVPVRPAPAVVSAAEPAPPVAPAPEPAPAAALPPRPEPAVPAIPGGSELPRIKTLEEMTDNWRNVPARAFPKRVAIKSPVEFDMGGGNRMKMAEGREVVPLALSAEGMLTVASGEGSATKAVIPVDQTDFKDRVTKRYNDGMVKILDQAVARQQAERERATTPEPGGTATPPATVAEGVPAAEADRNLALMRESVAAGALAGVTPGQVKAWRWIGFEEIEGVGYQTGVAVVTKQTYFGEYETEAKALIRNGEVERWVLPGVDE